MVEETTILEEIKRNKTKEQEVCKELEKEDGQSFEEDGIVYVDGRIYKQLEDQRKNTLGKPWTSRHRTPRITTNDGTDKTELLVVRNQNGCQEICSRIFQVPIE